MFLNVLRFELAFHLRRPVTALFAAVFFLLAFFFMASNSIVLGGAVGLVRKNSPMALTQLVIVLTAIGQVITTAIVGTATLRDYTYRTHELLFTTRLTRWSYLGGRFVGAYLVMLLIFAMIPLGAAAGSMMPWVDAEKLLAFNAWHFLQPYLLFGTTNLLLCSAIFFAVGVLTRNLLVIYVQGIVLLVAWSVSQQWMQSRDRDTLASLADAFGITTVEVATRYWTVVERNAHFLSLTGPVLLNRLIWLGVAGVLLVLAFALFRFEAAPRSFGVRRQRAPVAGPAAAATGNAAPAAAGIPRLAPDFGRATAARQLASVTRFSFLRIVRDLPFLAIVVIAAIDMTMTAWYADVMYGVTTYPVTANMAGAVAGGSFLYMLILSTVYAGESVWRDRLLGTAQITDSLPLSTATAAVGRILAVLLSLTLLLAALMLIGMAVQTVKGYTTYEPLLFVRYLFGATLPWMIGITFFAFAVHALVDNKFVGHVVIIVYWVATIVMGQVGFDHQLYRFGLSPAFTYSDMNGFGHFVANLALSAGYTNAIGLMLVTLALLAWRRGTDAGWSARRARARDRWPALRLAAGGTAFASIAFGGLIFYNTNMLNDYRSSRQADRESAEWERHWGAFRHLAPPRIQAVELEVELVPERRMADIAGRYLIRNREGRAIDSVLVNFPRGADVAPLVWSRPARRVMEDADAGTYMYVFDPPLEPGDDVQLDYRMGWSPSGFPNSDANNRVVANGTFLPTVGPSLGYDEGREISDIDTRRRQKLPPRERLPDLDDPEARRNSQFAIDSDRVRFAATISTAPDQIAVAPGYLEREWMSDGRRHFRYVMDQPIANFTTVVSARYTVLRDRWNDVDIEIYYHEPHTFNLERMVESVKASLDYFTANFSPYQFRVIRIVEFPRYDRFAQAFPTTIPYSEGIGFIMRVRDRDDDLDMPFFITAHEVAHQWWGHQVVGARAQGSAMIVESMAEYSALTVMEKRYGPTHVQKFLRHELDRYLAGRGNERQREQPLIRTENQGYIHYNKGALALYALRDYIGEDAMNRALRGYLDAHAWEEAPYSTAREFVAFLRAETPDSLQYFIEDLFETITLHDNRAAAASARRLEDGRYEVTLELHSRKVRADSLGTETEVPLADYIEVGVFGEREKGNALGRPLYLRKHFFTEPVTTVRVIVDEQPRSAGIDPYNKLIDRVPGDNIRSVGRPSG
jgi:ABC-2 type transport system permease protein